MEIVSARDFRYNQKSFLNKVLNGEVVFLKSSLGMFRILPAEKEDTLTERICKGLNEVKLVKTGKLKGFTVEEALNEL